MSVDHRSPRTVIVAATICVITIGAYVAWLGWHAPYVLDRATAVETGPYERPQVVGLALTWSAVVIAAVGWWGRPRFVVGWATAALVVAWSADQGSRITGDANLWPVGAMCLAIGAGSSGLVLAYAVAGLRALLRSRSGPR